MGRQGAERAQRAERAERAMRAERAIWAERAERAVGTESCPLAVKVLGTGVAGEEWMVWMAVVWLCVCTVERENRSELQHICLSLSCRCSGDSDLPLALQGVTTQGQDDNSTLM